MKIISLLKNSLVPAFLMISMHTPAQLSPMVIGTIHASDSIVVVYDVTVVNPLPAGVGKIGNQGIISGSNFANLVTDDPDTPVSLDTTFTIVQNPLPITLLDFSIMRQQAGILVRWVTSTEINNDRFEVEHSTDGRNFTPIGIVLAKGNSNTVTNYSFVHATPVTGWNYYRLKQTDKDGKSVTWYVRSVKFEKRDVPEMYVYPNPVTQRILNLQFNKVERGIYTLQVFNALGQPVFSRLLNYNGVNAPIAIVLPAAIARGIYSLQLQNSTAKMMKTIFLQ
ncbi:MAG: T9SS type A sorting domain-containing protein [Bacteroidota bacterium]